MYGGGGWRTYLIHHMNLGCLLEEIITDSKDFLKRDTNFKNLEFFFFQNFSRLRDVWRMGVENLSKEAA